MENFRLVFGVNTSKIWENHCIMCKAEYMSMLGHKLGKYFKRVPHVWEKKKWCIFADRVGFKVSFLEISQCRHLRDLITT